MSSYVIMGQSNLQANGYYMDIKHVFSMSRLT